ncbi:RND family transporter [Spongiibacter taiwanensis]
MKWLLNHPKLWVFIMLVLTVVLADQSRRFEINASADTLISEGNRDFIRSQKITQKFSPEEFLILAYQPKDGDIFSRQSQRDVADISRQIRALQRVQSVRSILSVPLLQAGEQALSSDTQPDQLTQSKLNLPPARLRAIFKGHPVYEGLLINPEQTISGIQVLFKADPELNRVQRESLALQEQRLEGELTHEQKIQLQTLALKQSRLEKTLREQRDKEIDEIRDIIAGYGSRAEIYMGGPHVLAYQLINIVQKDLSLFGTAIALVIAALIMLIFKRWRWLLITACCCSASVLITTGCFALAGLKATVISANFIALLLILTLAIVIHLIVQYREELAADTEASQYVLVQRTLKNKLAPCFFAGLTTSVGFASLLLSDIKPVSSFGLMMMLAMVITLVSTLLLLPSLLMLFPREQSRESSHWSRRPLTASGRLSLRRSTPVILFGALLLALSVVGSLRLSVENSFINYFKKDTDVYRELAFIDQHFGGSTPLDIVYRPERPAGQPSQLPLRAIEVQNTHRIQDMLDAQTGMGTTLSVVNFTKLAKQLNGNRPLTEYELAAVYWTLDKSIRKDLLGSLFLPDPAELRISARVKDSTEGLNRKQLLADIRQGMAELGITEQHYQISNLFVLYQSMLERLFASQILTLGAVFAVLTLVFWLVFRSLRIALLAMVPNMVASLSILGLMGWLGIPLDFMTMTIAAIAMGIAVDDTIHYTHRFLEERRQHSVETAIENTHQSVGYALLYTSTIIALGFALLMGSDFIPSVMFGLLTAAAVIIALIADLTLLPALLSRFAPKGKHAPA